MGCGISKIDVDGTATPTPMIRPSIRHRLDAMRRKRHNSRPLKKYAPTKKELLLHETDDHEIAYTSILKNDSFSCATYEGSRKENDHHNPMREVVEKESSAIGTKVNTNIDQEERVAKRIEAIIREAEEAGDEGEEDGDNDDAQRMIKRRVDEDGDSLPSSPSFRVYFAKGNVEDKKDERM